MNDTTKHTAGPWFIGGTSNGFEGGRYHVAITADGGFETAHGPTVVAQALCYKPMPDGVPIRNAASHVNEADANARLIAASPRLLATLRSVLPFAEALLECGEHAEHQANRDAVAEARAAIAQALGTDGG